MNYLASLGVAACWSHALCPHLTLDPAHKPSPAPKLPQMCARVPGADQGLAGAAGGRGHPLAAHQAGGLGGGRSGVRGRAAGGQRAAARRAQVGRRVGCSARAPHSWEGGGAGVRPARCACHVYSFGGAPAFRVDRGCGVSKGAGRRGSAGAVRQPCNLRGQPALAAHIQQVLTNLAPWRTAAAQL